MTRARFLASVETDLVDIFTYIAETSGSLAAARRYVARLRARCHHLAGLPSQMGRARPELAEGIRSATFGNHVIFFHYAGRQLEVVSILHGHRDIGTSFGGG